MLCLSGKQGSVQNDRSCDPTGVVKVCLFGLLPPPPGAPGGEGGFKGGFERGV